jgi:hypothetical protein
MYNLGILTHNYSVILLITVVFFNFIALFLAKELFAFRKKMAYTTPLGAVLLAAVLFTGTVMMIAKHADFTLQNIVMIVVGVLFIVLEAKRVKPLRRMKNVPEALGAYKDFAVKILVIEIVLLLGVSLWMWA